MDQALYLIIFANGGREREREREDSSFVNIYMY